MTVSFARSAVGEHFLVERERRGYAEVASELDVPPAGEREDNAVTDISALGSLAGKRDFIAEGFALLRLDNIKAVRGTIHILPFCTVTLCGG